MTTLSLALLIVFLLIVNPIGKLANLENELYSFPPKELSSYFSFFNVGITILSQFTLASLPAITRKSCSINLVAFKAVHKKHTTYYTNYFVELRNIKLLV